MSADIDVEIDECRSKLEALLRKLPTPEMITDTDRSEFSLRGNPAAYIALGIESLNAAQGQSVSIWQKYWLHSDSWTFSAPVSVPEVQDKDRQKAAHKWRWNQGTFILGLILLCICALILIGASTVVHWLVSFAKGAH
jgi:hypothetical protein